MSTPNFGFLEGVSTLQEVQGALAQLKRTLDFYFQGKLSSTNFREIAGWQVSEDTLMSEGGEVGFSTAGTLRIWAGSSNPSNAPFRVYEDGEVVVTNLRMLGGTIEWPSVGAPSYSQITGNKPPVNADNTDLAILGNGFTKIGATYIYTGTINAHQINVGTLQGFSIYGGVVATSSSGPRVEMSGSSLKAYGPTSVAQVEMVVQGPNSPALIFRNTSGTQVGSMFGVPTGNELNIVGPSSGSFISMLSSSMFIQAPTLWLMSSGVYILSSSNRVLHSGMNFVISQGGTHNHTGFAIAGGSHNHGIPPGTQLLVAGGGSVTFVESGNHTHDLWIDVVSGHSHGFSVI